ncbi:hypothetical protein EDD36DRAFT_417594 [Exophiala viscosa]|uniref:Uncharacterized protein n=1 Tax=Exophiala viscosa TaxID=2486360 RepID=A0AAN6DYF2_9EURO|nr:hypothetical protein EDD36DRAFT_417594 [Exophiala viscosa]
MSQVACCSLASLAHPRCETDQPDDEARVMDDDNGYIRQHSQDYDNMGRRTAASNEHCETGEDQKAAQKDLTSGIETHVETPERTKEKLANVTMPLEVMKSLRDSSAQSLGEIRKMKAAQDCPDRVKAIERWEKVHDDINSAYNAVEHQYNEALKAHGTPNHLDALLFETCAFFVSATQLLTDACNGLKAGMKEAKAELHKSAERGTFLRYEVDKYWKYLDQDGTLESFKIRFGELQLTLERQKALTKRAGDQVDKLSNQLHQGREQGRQIINELKRSRAEIERVKKFEKDYQQLKVHDVKLRQAQEETRKVLAELDKGSVEIEQAREINNEYERLKAENVKLHRVEAEVGRLRKQLKDADIKGLKERNQELQTLLRKVTAESKKLNDLPADEPDIQDDAAEVDLASVSSRKAFPEAAFLLLRKLKGSINRLCSQVNDMKETRGGNGWGIVERTAGMVTEAKTDMTKDIKECLELRDREMKSQARTEELSIEDFPPLPDVAVEMDDNEFMKENMKVKGKKGKSVGKS